MTRLLMVLLVTGLVGLVANPTPADAQGDDNNLEYLAVRCAKQAEQSCNDEFGGNDWRNIGIRGWCMLIRTAACMATEGGGEKPEEPVLAS